LEKEHEKINMQMADPAFINKLDLSRKQKNASKQFKANLPDTISGGKNWKIFP